ncbi:hypothetical protein TGAM01_v201380 [Trichoderma gamsii]|uniref:Uncharacterized protein n=1 Tax=Trichoderma gamsii TaxID=398673 RepID=A0A2P5A0D6_9HYPO|nr:hypothetical protein TGAM01_v201380 [Trichoderma gamsii]PON30014.1 hypothetical protein TGAM01_v201380 [Trichoderma gamsii]
MAEALGVASGVVGIVSFGIELCQGLLEYYNSWKDAESEVTTTYNSLQDLTKILLLVKSTLNDQDLKSEIFVKVHDSIALCEGGIADLSKKLQKIQIFSLRDTVGERLLSQARRALYPFKKSTLIKLQEIVEDLQDRLHFTLTILDINISLQNFDIVSGQLRLLSVKADKTQIGIGNIQSSLADIDRKIDTIESIYGSEYLRDFYKWLSPVFDVFEKRQHDIFELPGRQDGTWEWLQSTQEFKDWLSGTNRILWCPGQPGVGKTVLSSSIINHLKTQVKQSNIGIAYLYCDYSNALLTVPNLIGSLLQQLFQQCPKVPGGLLELYKIRKSNNTETVRLTLRECSTFLRDVIETFSDVFVVVDGLDECPHREIDDIRDQLLDQLKALPLKTQLLFTSRDLPAIALKFATDRRLEIHASRHAIEGYLQARINNSKNLRRHIQRKPDLRQAIIDTVAQKADGMFLLVRIYIDLLATKNVLGMVESTLRNLPEGLKELDTAYDDVITRIQNQDDDDVAMAKQILTWLYYAARPLTLQELRHSLAVNLVAEADPDATELDEAFLPDEEVIASVCAGIVTCHAESNTVSFIHYTTKEYFKRRIDRQQVERFLHLEVSIAETCLRYLSFEREELEQFVIAKREKPYWYTFQKYTQNECPEWDIDTCYPLFRYAARYWGDHANSLLRQVTKGLIMKFVMQPTALAASFHALIEQEDLYLYYFPIFFSGLYLASFFGLNEIVMMLLEAGQQINTKNKQNWTALHMAAARGHAVTVQLLVDRGADVNAATYKPNYVASGSTALHWAAGNGHEKVLEVLLENGAEIDLQTPGHETALHWAAQHGHVGAITLLLNKGANLEVHAGHWLTPLESAASRGEEAAVRVLIDRGADLSNTTDSGRPLLHLAAQGGCVEVVQLLLKTGCDVNGGSALWAAAGSQSQRRDELVRLLLKEGADVSERLGDSAWLDEYKGETALHHSAREGFDTTVRLLLENGAEVDARNEDGETSLHLAAVEGCEIVVQVLLEQGADVAAKNQTGETALQLAARIGHEGIVRHLLDHLGEEINSQALLATAKIFKVATAGDEKAMQVLIEDGADITIKGQDEETALHVAAKEGHVALSRFLLENGANINALNRYEMTPISKALD